MSGYAQTLFSASRVAGSEVHLAPPLRLVWTAKGSFASRPVLAQGDHVIVRGCGTLYCVRGGRELWRATGFDSGLFVLSGGSVLATGRPGSEPRLIKMDLASGERLLDAPCPVYLTALLPDGRRFVGAEYTKLSEEHFRTTVALVSVGPPVELVWSVESEGNIFQIFELDLACDSKRVFVSNHESLLALDLATGRQVWNAPLGELGGSAGSLTTNLMVSEGRVVISTGDGYTAAFDAESGRELWCFKGYGWRTVYGGRVYVETSNYYGEYCVLDLTDGRELLRTRLYERIKKKWPEVKNPDFSTALLVTETHTFIGDTGRRLFAFDRDTGEPVWYHKPKGTRGFLAAEPAVADGRLYIPTYSPDEEHPGQLYCYEATSR